MTSSTFTPVSDDFIRAARQGKFNEVYVALPMRAEVIMARIVNELADCQSIDPLSGNAALNGIPVELAPA